MSHREFTPRGKAVLMIFSVLFIGIVNVACVTSQPPEMPPHIMVIETPEVSTYSRNAISKDVKVCRIHVLLDNIGDASDTLTAVTVTLGITSGQPVVVYVNEEPALLELNEGELWISVWHTHPPSIEIYSEDNLLEKFREYRNTALPVTIPEHGEVDLYLDIAFLPNSNIPPVIKPELTLELVRLRPVVIDLPLCSFQ